MNHTIPLFLLSLLLFACSTAPSTIPSQNTTLTSTPNLVATKTSNAIRTATPFPIPSHTSTPSPTPTPLPAQTITPTSTPASKIISVNNVNNLNVVGLLGQGIIDSVAINPDRQVMVVAGSIGIWSYDLNTLELLDRQFNDRERIYAVSWSPDGTQLAIGGTQGKVYIENTVSDEDYIVLDDKLADVTQLNWSPNSKLLASVWSDNSIDIWDVANNTKVQSVKQANLSYVGQTAWSPNSTQLASGGGDGMLQIWDVASGDNIFSLEGEVEEVVGEGWLPNGLRSVSWSPDGQWIATGYESGTILIINVNEKQSFTELHNHNASVENLRWSDDSSKLLSVDWGGSIQVFNIYSGNTLALGKQQAGIIGAMWLGDEQAISWGVDGVIRLWNLTQPNDGQVLIQHSPSFRSIAWSPKGSELAVGGDDATVRVINAENGQLTHVLEGHGSSVSALAWSPDGSMLASGDLSGIVNIWNSDTKEIMFVLKNDSISSLAWAPDSSKLAVTNYDGNIATWSIQEGEILWHRSSYIPLSVAWSPNSDRLIVGTFGRVLIVLDSETGELLYNRDEQPSGGVNSVAWNSDGSKFVSGGTDTIYLWNSNNGKLLNRFQGHDQGHFNVIKSVVFSPDGSLLASGAYDSTIHLWDTVTGQSIKTLTAHRGKVEGVVWSPDGTNLASAGSEGIVYIWGFGPSLESNPTTDESILNDSDFPLPIPMKEPNFTWNELPVMPQAIAGDENDLGYYYTVKATINDIEAYYTSEMSKLGWSYLGDGNIKEETLLHIFYLFQQGNEMVSLSVYPLDSNLSYVTLGRYTTDN